ncbi:helix-turn-helix domain-containing protein [Pseudomonas sp. H2_H09]
MVSSNSPRSMQDFSQNLRLLCGYYKSVAMVCRSLDINRQQFNKYLGAQAAPSLFTLRKICAFFGVDEDEIFSEHESFRALLSRQRAAREPDSAVPADFFSKLRTGAVEVSGLLLCLFDVALRVWRSH